MKNLALVLLVSTFGLMSCQKKVSSDPPVDPSPESFTEMQINSSFNWNTTTDFTIKVEGLPTDMQAKRTLVVQDMSGNVLFKKVVRLTDDDILEFRAPTALAKVKVLCGSIQKEVEFTNQRGDFNFLPEEDLSDLDPEDR